MKLSPVAFESLGVRSMCTLIETRDLNILVDPGASLGPRWGLLPHPREYAALKKARERIVDLAKRVDVVTVSHYHYDHYSPSWKQIETVWTWSGRQVAQEVFGGKTVFVKDIRSNINFGQRRRGWFFQDTVKQWVKSLEVADGRSYEKGSTRISFSEPVSHGEESSPLGYVLMLCVECDEGKVMHCSDVQGPGSEAALDMILQFEPNIAIIGGPPFYLSGFRVPEKTIESSLRNATKVVSRIPMVIYDHHSLRSEDCFEKMARLRHAAKRNGHRIVTAAEFSGLPNQLLEAKRRELYEKNPPNDSFREWAGLSEEKRRRRIPPI